MISSEKEKELSDRLGALRGIFDIDAKKIEITNLEEKNTGTKLWDDAQQAEKLMREIRNLKKWVEHLKISVKK